jgi:putative colanic acid biosynthesis acetyltransferase WcaF
MTLDIAANRRASKYSPKEQMLRVLWGGGRWAFRLIPRPLYGLRRAILRCFGAKIGANVNVSPTARIYFPWMLELGEFAAIGDEAFIYNLGPVIIGARATVSQRAHLCAGTHDYADPAMPLIRATIAIGADAWICADAFIGPGVTVGDGAVVGARGAVFRDVDPWTIVGGNPATVIRQRVVRGREGQG